MVDVRELRREPPAFRRVMVGAVEDLTPHLRRITLVGEELAGLEVDEPAASVRLLMPSPGHDELVMPEWTGNEFLLPDGRRPLIRTLTPRSVRDGEIDVDVVLHGDVGLSGWASRARSGDPAAVSGPGRGYEIDAAASRLVVLGDETALAAIAQLLEAAPETLPLTVHVETAHGGERAPLPRHPAASITWHDLSPGARPGSMLLDALVSVDIDAGTRVWAAGEAAAMQAIRTHLGDRGVDRARTTVRGYWKHGRPGPGL